MCAPAARGRLTVGMTYRIIRALELSDQGTGTVKLTVGRGSR